jgi:sarcosine oxidase subunit alpha
MKRLSSGTRIDLGSVLHFTFDGKAYTGFAGDTLASALLANGVKIMGRSFKLHRPRGVLGAGLEEPNALVTRIENGVREPNLQATMVELREGLVAQSQNRWPSLQTDFGAINQWGGKIFGAGFYYKTFFGPLPNTRIWHFFEWFIRRAAGLGRAGTVPDTALYDRMNAFCDVLVVGAGAAGLEAAAKAAKDGRRVIVAHLSPPPVHSDTASQPGHVQSATIAEIAELPNVRFLSRTMVWGAYDGDVFAAIERVAEHRTAAPGEPRHRHWVIRAHQIILATGASERPLVFPGNDRPGIMLASAMQHYAQNYGVLTGGRIVFFTNNDSAYAAARDLANLGAGIIAIIDVRSEISAEARAMAAEAGAEIIPGCAIVATHGRKGLTGITLQPVDAAGNTSGPTRKMACDALGVSGGFTPLIALSVQKGAKPQFSDELQAFLPPELPENWQAVGAVTGDGLPDPAPVLLVRAKAPTDKAFIDFQHDVTDTDIDLAHLEGFTAIEHLKRYTTLGMATDQGRTSHVAGMSRMATLLGKTIAQTGTTRLRAPFAGVSLGSIAAERFGHIMPNRLTPMHDWHLENGGQTYAAGLWHRPMAYPQSGETIEQAYVREARAVRSAAGLVDVSTLGKILVQGPDSAEFLDRIYTNMMSTLPVMKARYGLILREDGLLFDDGTAWRLASNSFLVTTTTANAGKVMEHLEYCLDCIWPELQVIATSVTDQWGAMALSGPQARNILEKIVMGTSVENDALPHMGIVHGTVDGVRVMIARLSFSGERAYEIYAPAGHAGRVWEAIIAAGTPCGLLPYGLEALGTLRIEKGHVTGAEIDGRTTAADLGLGGMLSKKKPFIGSAMVGREGLVQEGRLQLVGVKSLDGRALNGGAHIVEQASISEIVPSLGHVTAACYSPQLGAYAGLALVSDGKKRIGQKLILSDPLRNMTMPVEIISPVMVDPEGSRMHG